MENNITQAPQGQHQKNKILILVGIIALAFAIFFIVKNSKRTLTTEQKMQVLSELEEEAKNAPPISEKQKEDALKKLSQ